MKLLWGLWNIPMWGYYWGYTAAQIELMAADCPITVYNHKGKRNKKNKFDKADAYDVERKAKEWKDKYGKGTDGIQIDLSGYSIK